MTPLYGHVNSDTAFLVESYPFGRLRCRAKFWLESDPKRGFRFVMQTENPKNKNWNAPKRSTYMLLAGCMLLDSNNHVHWKGLSEYSDAQDVMDFIKDFPLSDLSRLHPWIIGKRILSKRTADGKANISFNRVPQIPSEHEIDCALREIQLLNECEHMLTMLKNG